MSIWRGLRRCLTHHPRYLKRRYRFQAIRRLGPDVYEVQPYAGVTFEARAEDLVTLQEIYFARRYGTLFPFGEDATVVDIGAHCGYFSVFAATKMGPGGRVIAFEPEPHNHASAARHLELNRMDSVTLVQKGVHGRSGTHRLRVSADAPAQHAVVEDADPAHLPGESVAIDTLSALDLFKQHDVEHCDFMKLDCEGSEYPFLYQAPDAILKRITTISLEFHDRSQPGERGGDLAAYLASKGFTIVELRNSPTCLDLNYGELLATRRW